MSEKKSFKSYGYRSQEFNGFIAYFHFTGWADLSLGIHISLKPLNIEIHVPFGFFRVGNA